MRWRLIADVELDDDEVTSVVAAVDRALMSDGIELYSPVQAEPVFADVVELRRGE